IVLLIVLKVVIACSFIFYLCNYLSRFTDTVMISIAIVMVVLMVFSRSIKNGSIRIERLFMQNLHSRDIAEQVKGRKRPLYENRLLDRDVHLADFDVPMDTQWMGQQLSELRLRQRFGVHVSSIWRANRRLNIPDGNSYIYPGDRIQVIGSDDQLTKFGAALRS
ncbi:TrkA C-terminal domain-containing protein, partial [Parabacteroides distasonis]